jgi:AraC family transcriptional regulator
MPKRLKHHFSLRNMHCECCLRLLRLELERAGIQIVKAELGEVTLTYDPSQYNMDQLVGIIKEIGFEVIESREDILVEEIKKTVIELIHHSTYNAMVRNSDFLVGRFNKSYQHLSAVFSKRENITLEKFIIRQRIAKAMELMQDSDLTLSEIAYSMGYSSVQYLSSQFKEVAGISVTEFRKDMAQYRTGFMLGMG